MKNRKWLRWTGIVLGSLFGLFLLAAILVPLFVDVDRFRPQIVQTANGFINGKLELGKLHLSLWGRLKIKVDGFSLADAKGRKVVSVRDVAFHLPFFSFLTGSPRLSLVMKHPEVIVIKDKDGINALTLVKSQGKSETQPAAEMPKIPGIVAAARLGFEMIDAKLAYIDRLTDLTSQVNALNVVVRDLFLTKPTEIEVSAQLDTKMGKVLSVKGPAVLTAKAQPDFTGGQFRNVAVQVKGDLNKVQIFYGDLFQKSASVPMNIEGSFSATATSATIESLVARFHNAEIKISGGVTELATKPQLKFNAASNEIQMGPWSQLVPMLKTYELTGAASLKAQGGGPMGGLSYGADFVVKALKAKSPLLKAQPQIDAVVKVVTDKVERMEMTFRAPGNDLRVVGSVVSFTKPKVRVDVRSNGMDLDQLMEFPKSKGGAAGSSSKTAKSSSGSGKKSDFDAMLDPLRESPIAAATDAAIGVQLKFVKAMNVRMEPIEGTLNLRQLVASVDRFRMGVFDGKIASDAAFELKPKTPRYTFSMEVAGLDIKKAVTSQFEMFKNTLYGIAAFKIKGKGASFNPEPAKANLDATGNLAVANANFATLDVGRMAAEAVNKAIVGLEGKIPQLRGKKLATPDNKETGYETATASFTINKGKFSMPDFRAISGKHRGIDIQGATLVGLSDYRLDASWNLVDTHNLTGARNLTIDINGVRVDPLLSEPNQPVKFPVRVSGTLFAPEPSYTSVAESLGRVALANIGRAAEAKIKQELQAKAGSELKKLEKKAAPEVQKAIQGLGKSLGL